MEKKSGKQWVQWANENALNSNSLSTLSAAFKPKVENFIQALVNGGALIKIETTQRSPVRAYLFHWSWLVSLEKAKPSDPPAKVGVDIIWDHGDDAASILGAKEMVSGFGLAVPPKSQFAPSLTSNHILGNAIDMQITWNGKIKVKAANGSEVEINFTGSQNTNEGLIKLGATYGVLKLRNDEPHWSFNGR